MSAAFWRGKKVFVTGHTGFKGAWLTTALVEMGAEVTGFALAPPTNPSLFTLVGLSKSIHHIEGDVRDGEQLEALNASGCQLALHLAAQPLVRRSYNAPIDTFATNVMGTVNFLEAVRRAPAVRSAVVITSDKCYLNNDADHSDAGRLFVEDDKLGGSDPYSASKAAAEIAALSYFESFLKPAGIPMATARAGNVIGGGDWAEDRLIPDAFRAYIAGRPLSVRFPHAIRPWQHVLEPLRGYMLLAQRMFEDGMGYAGAWNFGPRPSSIKSVAYLLERLQATLPIRMEIDLAPQPHEARLLGLDVGKAERELGWTPRVSVDDGISLAAEWYRDFADGKDAAIITRRQMRAYFELE